MESQTAPNVTNLNDSSPTATSSAQKTTSDFKTAPLLGLLPKPTEEMTLDELREFVVNVNRLRLSPQTFRAELNAEGNSAAAVRKEKQLDTLSKYF